MKMQPSPNIAIWEPLWRKLVRFNVSWNVLFVPLCTTDWYYCPGLWLHESGAIGASPDGIVTQGPALVVTVNHQNTAAKGLLPDLIEVKCPYRARDMTVLEAATTFSDFYLGNYYL